MGRPGWAGSHDTGFDFTKAIILPVLLAHPLTEATGLPVSPLVAASLAVSLLIAVALLWPDRRPAGIPDHDVAPADPGDRVESWWGRLSRPQVVTRAVGVALLVLAVAAGRAGSERELDNIASALVIGAGWPLLVLGSALVGPVWRWLDPWDGVGRLFERDPVGKPVGTGGPDGGTRDVRTAALVALPWVWYLSAYPRTLSPRAVGAALAVYTIAMVAGSLALGRTAWLPRAELFGLLFGWVARLPRGLLGTWRPPRGAELVLGVLAGGLLFGAVRQSPLWGRLNVVPAAQAYAIVGVVAAAAGGAALLWFLARSAGRAGALGSVSVAAVPAVASLILALGMGRNRLFTSVQLLPRLASDPLGQGWDLFGTADWGIVADPLGQTGLVAARVAVLMAGHLAGAILLARRAAPAARAPGTIALAATLAGGVAAVTAV